MINGIRCRCYPNRAQQIALSQWIGCARVIYNAKVSEMNYFHTFSRKLLGSGPRPPIDQVYSHFKDRELTPFLFEVPSQVLRNASTQFMTAWQRFLKGLASRPAIKKKGHRDSVLLTNELFSFDIDTGVLTLGIKTKPLGSLRVSLHRDVAMPKSIVISKKADRWYVSFNFEDVTLPEPRSQDEILTDLSHLTEDELSELTWGGDRGVHDMLSGSDDRVFHVSAEQKSRDDRREKRKKSWQRRMARQKIGSNRRAKSKRVVSRISSQQADVRRDFAHKTSHALVSKTDFQVFTFEDLKIANMTKRPDPKLDEETGEYLPNGAAAKAGLNRSILKSCWGSIYQFTHYKAVRSNKVVIKIPAHYSSQTCSECGHTSPKNRDKKRFLCTGCGFLSDADANASRVIKQRGVKHILDLEWKKKAAPKKVRFTKNTGSGLVR